MKKQISPLLAIGIVATVLIAALGIGWTLINRRPAGLRPPAEDLRAQMERHRGEQMPKTIGKPMMPPMITGPDGKSRPMGGPPMGPMGTMAMGPGGPGGMPPGMMRPGMGGPMGPGGPGMMPPGMMRPGMGPGGSGGPPPEIMQQMRKAMQSGQIPQMPAGGFPAMAPGSKVTVKPSAKPDTPGDENRAAAPPARATKPNG